jgi:hypothetical protein
MDLSERIEEWLDAQSDSYTDVDVAMAMVINHRDEVEEYIAAHRVEIVTDLVKRVERKTRRRRNFRAAVEEHQEQPRRGTGSIDNPKMMAAYERVLARTQPRDLNMEAINANPVMKEAWERVPARKRRSDDTTSD